MWLVSASPYTSQARNVKYAIYDLYDIPAGKNNVLSSQHESIALPKGLCEIILETMHEFQGQENEIMILLLVRSNDIGK